MFHSLHPQHQERKLNHQVLLVSIFSSQQFARQRELLSQVEKKQTLKYKLQSLDEFFGSEDDYSSSSSSEEEEEEEVSEEVESDEDEDEDEDEEIREETDKEA